mmetsp:Transcript_18796/g.34844  ORF Transcript_18796/g.34844 Transcript_18796/m.34844 type:complete len:247 (+) Transcript_18796:436-1176(+)
MLDGGGCRRCACVDGFRRDVPDEGLRLLGELVVEEGSFSAVGGQLVAADFVSAEVVVAVVLHYVLALALPGFAAEPLLLFLGRLLFVFLLLRLFLLSLLLLLQLLAPLIVADRRLTLRHPAHALVLPLPLLLLLLLLLLRLLLPLVVPLLYFLGPLLLLLILVQAPGALVEGSSKRLLRPLLLVVDLLLQQCHLLLDVLGLRVDLQPYLQRLLGCVVVSEQPLHLPLPEKGLQVFRVDLQSLLRHV